ncbi:MAG TPA: hypothetical protein VK781_10465 [Solirubrobacteraceae bacterium]|nr:hypothetical protein [Solirubrobacteraceae bacterium]
MTTTGEPWPKSGVSGALESSLPPGITEDVLIEAQLAIGANDTKQLGECAQLIGDGAEHERGYAGVERPVLSRESVCLAVFNPDAHRGLRRGLERPFAQVWLGLDRDDLADGGRIVREVRATASPKLNDATAQAREQLAAMLSAASPVGLLGDLGVDAGKEGGAGALGYQWAISERLS